MIYPEFLRVRRVLTWGVIGVSILVLLNILTVLAEHLYPEHVNLSAEGPSAFIPFSAVFAGIGFVIAGVATALGTGLNRYREHAEVVMTLPISRARFAVSVLAIDLAGLIVAFILATLLCVFIPFTVNGLWPHVRFDADILPRILVSIGAAFLTYALIAACSAWVPGRAGFIAGLSWPFFLLLSILAHQGGSWLGALFSLINYANPLQYLGINVTDGVAHTNLPIPLDVQIPIVFGLSLAACAIAVAGWKQQEI